MMFSQLSLHFCLSSKIKGNGVEGSTKSSSLSIAVCKEKILRMEKGALHQFQYFLAYCISFASEWVEQVVFVLSQANMWE